MKRPPKRIPYITKNSSDVTFTYEPSMDAKGVMAVNPGWPKLKQKKVYGTRSHK